MYNEMDFDYYRNVSVKLAYESVITANVVFAAYSTVSVPYCRICYNGFYNRDMEFAKE